MILRNFYLILLLFSSISFAGYENKILCGVAAGAAIFLVDYCMYNCIGKLFNHNQTARLLEANRYAEEVTNENKEFALIIDDVVSCYCKDANSKILSEAINALSTGCNRLKDISNQHLTSTPSRIKIFEAESLLKMYKGKQNTK